MGLLIGDIAAGEGVFKSIGLLLGELGVFAKIVFATAAIAAAVALFDALTTTVDESRESLANYKQEFKDNESEITSLTSQLDEVKEKIEELNSQDNLSFTDQEELDSLSKQNSLGFDV